ncbi:hypothetical protein LTR22_027941 [Elasticomyces elasticus]|nr:hypothetical protein LTR22_027941 [Elasticomyces elasticus]
MAGADDARISAMASGEGKGEDESGRGRNGRVSRHMLVHLPQIERLLKDGDRSGECDVSSMWTRVGRIWEDEGRWNESKKLFFAARVWRMEKLGEEHPDTLTAMADLASTYCNQGRWKEAEEVELEVMEASARVLGEEQPDTLATMNSLAATYSIKGDKVRRTHSARG